MFRCGDGRITGRLFEGTAATVDLARRDWFFLRAIPQRDRGAGALPSGGAPRFFPLAVDVGLRVPARRWGGGRVEEAGGLVVMAWGRGASRA